MLISWVVVNCVMLLDVVWYVSNNNAIIYNPAKTILQLIGIL